MVKLTLGIDKEEKKLLKKQQNKIKLKKLFLDTALTNIDENILQDIESAYEEITR